MSETPNTNNPNIDSQAFYEKQCLDLLDLQTKQAAEMERTGIITVINDIVAKKYGPEFINGLSRPVVYYQHDVTGGKRIERFGVSVLTKDPAYIADDSYMGSQCPVVVIELDRATNKASYPSPEFNPLQVQAIVDMGFELKDARNKGDLPDLNGRLTEINRP